MTDIKPYLSPPEFAARLGVKPDKILEWIRSGELRAVNIAQDPKGKRPRWRIPIEEILRFELNRSNAPPPPPIRPRRRRRQRAPGVTEFF